jgi:hypothetical protein
MPALTIVISAVTDNDVIVRKPPKKIVSETAYIALALVVAQARNSLIDLIIVWKELTTLRERKKSFIITDGNLAGNGANRGSKNDSKHIIDGKENNEKRARRRREAKVIK